ncbi:hypothetical protein HETIRDRAFT_166747 [Heterobasidion irregulare TC 32-1]|uniref:Uncharacterized protein n=1 Tax=Heterobasidion irregulare (strain TC 32-1) TaxID=747525 RepID=W4KQ78_HETIT|nr:uncharacterized protein HETIRDRAFT_166747 [Heterobasidion irregulare TC 32-1]ETW87211.1 hypothetical protein HETIRDRAFT_166747 [Heterobasidion irregulare TC 32-1]
MCAETHAPITSLLQRLDRVTEPELGYLLHGGASRAASTPQSAHPCSICSFGARPAALLLTIDHDLTLNFFCAHWYSLSSSYWGRWCLQNHL